MNGAWKSVVCAAVVLVAVEAVPSQQTARKFDPEFARSLLAVEDQDGDGLSELLIANPRPSEGGPARFHVWSPGANRCLRSFDHGVRMA